MMNDHADARLDGDDGRRRKRRRRRAIAAATVFAVGIGACVTCVIRDNRYRLRAAEQAFSCGDLPAARRALDGGIWLLRQARARRLAEIDRQELSARQARAKVERPKQPTTAGTDDELTRQARQAADTAQTAAEAARASARGAGADRCLPQECTAADKRFALGRAAFDEGNFTRAREHWDAANAAWAAAESRTLAARKAAEQARTAAGQAKRTAEQADAATAAPKPWASAGETDASAAALFKDSRFGEAADKWNEALRQYTAARARAEAKARFEAALATTEDALKTKLGTADGPVLSKYGGDAWQRLTAARGRADFAEAEKLLPAAAARAELTYVAGRIEALRARAEGLLAEGKFVEARRPLAEARRLRDDDPALRALAAKVDEAEFASLVGQADELTRAAQFDQARAQLRLAAKVLPGDARLKAVAAKVDGAEFQRRLAAGRQALDASKLAEAKAALARAKELLPGDPNTAGLARAIRGKEIAIALAEPTRLRALGEFEQAKAALAAALSAYPDDPNVASLAAEIACLQLRYEPAGRPMTGHDGWIYAVAFAPDGKRIVSASGDGKALIWSAGLGAPVATLPGHLGGATCAAWSPDGKHVACGCVISSVLLWGVEAPHARTELKGHVGIVGGLAFSRDGGHLASGGFDKLAYVWDAAGAARPLVQLAGHGAQVVSLAFSPDGKLLATGCTKGDPGIRLWDWRARKLVRTMPASPANAHEHDVHSLAFLPDGRELLSASHDKSIRIWSVATGRLLRKFVFADDLEFSAVAVAPDGVRAACACRPGIARFEVRLLDLVSGKTLDGLGGKHTDFVTAVAFSPDGATVVSGSRDKKLWLWRAARAAAPK